jgi:hypothetical protein
MEPYLAKDLIGGIWTPGDAAMSPYKVCFAFIEEGKKFGLNVFTYCNIKEIKLGNNNQVEKLSLIKEIY